MKVIEIVKKLRASCFGSVFLRPVKGSLAQKGCRLICIDPSEYICPAAHAWLRARRQSEGRDACLKARRPVSRHDVCRKSRACLKPRHLKSRHLSPGTTRTFGIIRILSEGTTSVSRRDACLKPRREPPAFLALLKDWQEPRDD